MDSQSAASVRKVYRMLPLRKELHDYSRGCEALISASLSPDTVAFTPKELESISYYATEITSLVDGLVLRPLPAQPHERDTMREYVRASNALLGVANLSNDERISIRRSVNDIGKKILYASPLGAPPKWKQILRDR
jgi:hypothetical protein